MRGTGTRWGMMVGLMGVSAVLATGCGGSGGTSHAAVKSAAPAKATPRKLTFDLVKGVGDTALGGDRAADGAGHARVAASGRPLGRRPSAVSGTCPASADTSTIRFAASTKTTRGS